MGLKDVCTENGSSRGQNLALTGLFVPSSLNCGLRGRVSQPSLELVDDFMNTFCERKNENSWWTRERQR